MGCVNGWCDSVLFYFIFDAVVAAGEETELLVGMKNDGNLIN